MTDPTTIPELNDALVPVDIVTPHGTIRAGTRLSVVITRMNLLYDLLVQYNPVTDPGSDAIRGWEIFFGNGSSKLYPPHYSIHHFTAMGMAAVPLYGRPMPEVTLQENEL